ncbi:MULTISPECIES: hypothetical protein [unclassified Streptomyces]|uniref:hypothetical protein n=1 Tax=unclassified Streptomyces TaxID=2593676 RepID=UPI00336A9AFD
MGTTVYRAAYGDTVRHRRRIIQRGDGNVTFDEEVWLPEEYVDVPRAGMEFELAEDFDTASWIGLGPWENYPDRSSSALRGRCRYHAWRRHLLLEK